MQYEYSLFNEQPKAQQPTQPSYVMPMNPQQSDAFVAANVRNVNAQSRIHEANAKRAEAEVVMTQAQILLNGMAELRLALHLPAVDKDQGAVAIKEGAVLAPLFSEQNVENIQINYMKLYQKYEAFADMVINKYSDDFKK